MKRESFKSRLGFLLVSAGCAIGIGNVWKFPYVTGQNGGGVFVLFYLLFLLIMGAPILTMELAIGRASRKSVVLGYKELEPEGSKWHLHGWICILGCYMLMMYYTTVSGWMLHYMLKFVSGTFHKAVAAEAAQDVAAVTNVVGNIFDGMLASPAQMLGYMAVTVLMGITVCSLGLQKGIEKVTKVMMLGLLALIVVLAVHSLTLEGAGEGIRFYLLPDLKRTREIGLGKVITAAMNQSFFTLSLGVAAMEIFGSYMSKDFTLGGESLRICSLDTFVALLSGLIIFPACFAYGVEPSAGPVLIFVTLPQVFLHMAGGRIWGTCFFLFMTFASFSTVIAVFENLLATAMDNFGWSRKKSAVINFAVILLTGIPCALGYNLWSMVHPIGGRDILNSEDFIVSNLILPIGSLVFLLFCVTKWGWGFEKYREEVNTGVGVKIPEGFKYYFRFILPVLILIILIQGLL
ncbi:MAG: sodium-dependent transporter [Lachnospiraceae bacterium]|nr:sodium-dependent transporter [Lachnospiraceae bacterium]